MKTIVSFKEEAVERRFKERGEKSFGFETERIITKNGFDYSIIIKFRNNNIKDEEKSNE